MPATALPSDAAERLLSALRPGVSIPLSRLAATHGGSKAVETVVRRLRQSGYGVFVLREPAATARKVVRLEA